MLNVEINSGMLKTFYCVTKTDWRNRILKRRYKIPLRTKVEIISEDSIYNGRIGTLEAKDPDGLSAHKVIFENGEFDIFMDEV